MIDDERLPPYKKLFPNGNDHGEERKNFKPRITGVKSSLKSQRPSLGFITLMSLERIRSKNDHAITTTQQIIFF